MIPLPRLYVNGKFNRLVHPASVNIVQNTKPLSTASMTLLQGEELPARSWVELFNPYGSAGMFRVRSPRNAYGESTSTAELEHMIAEVGDYCVKAEYSEMIAASTAVTKVFSHYKGGKWKLGDVKALGSGRIALEAKYDSVLSVLLSILQQKPDCMMSFDFSTNPWTLAFVKKGTKVVSEGRLTRNVTSAEITYDDSELCTRCWYQTFTTDDEGNITATWTYKDADTLKTYGVVENRINTSSDMTTEEINATVNNYLKAHKQPKTSVRIQGVELSKITGERVDKFVNGDLFRLAMPDYNLTVELNIESLAWTDVYNDQMDVEVHLGDEEDSVVTFLHNLDATGSGVTGGSGGGGGKSKQEEKWQEYRVRFEEDEYHWGVVSEHVDHSERVLQAAGIDVDSRTGVVIYAKDNANQIGSRIKAESDRISLVVSGTGEDAKIKTASIVTAINEDKSESSIKLDADRIHLEGYTTLTEFSALKGTVNTLAAGTFTGVGIRCGSLSINAAQFTLGVSVVWKSTIKDGDGNTVNVMKWG